MAQLREGSIIKKPTGDEVIATVNDIPEIPTSLPADGGNADTVNSFTVNTNVPANAKFTDTTYTEITTAEIDAGTASTLRTVTGRRIKYLLDIVHGWINGLTKSDIGLGNVDNAKQATKVEFDTHNTDGVRHITDAERTNWNAKSNLALGTTSTTAYRGDLGNTAYTHSQSTHARTDATNTVNNATNGSITVNGVAQVVYTHPSSHPASMITESATKRFVSDTEKSTWNAKASTSVATTSADGLMANTDKAKLDGVQAGAQVNTVTSVAGKTGAVTVTKANVALGSVLNYGLSTQLEAEVGTSNAKYMTPLRTKQAIDKQVADKNYVTQDELGDAGFGDMVKSIYDTNNNGIVDNAEKLGGQLPSYYQQALGYTPVNKSGDTMTGQLRVESTTFPVIDIARNTSSTGGNLYGGARLQRKTTNPTNGVGIGFYFQAPNSNKAMTHAGMFGGALGTIQAGSEKGEIVISPSYAGQDPYTRRDLIVRAISTSKAEAELNGKLKTDQTLASDTNDTVATKKYVDNGLDNKVNNSRVLTDVPANAKFTDTIYTHPAGTNPHGTTKSDVGLSSVLNYGIATQAEAETGTSNAKYMTPLRVKQAIDSSPVYHVGKTPPPNNNLLWINTNL